MAKGWIPPGGVKLPPLVQKLLPGGKLPPLVQKLLPGGKLPPGAHPHTPIIGGGSNPPGRSGQRGQSVWDRWREEAASRQWKAAQDAAGGVADLAQAAETGITSLPMDKASRMERAQDMGFGEQVLYHGTAADIDKFKGITWSSESPELANEYAAERGSEGGDRHRGVGRPYGPPRRGDVVYPIRIKPGESFDADTLDEYLTLDSFANELMVQARKAGRKVEMPKAKEQLEKIRAAFMRESDEGIMRIVNNERYREEYGDDWVESFGPLRRAARVNQKFDRHNFWFGAEEIFGEDGAQAIQDLIRLAGFDSIKVTEEGHKTIGILNPKNIRSSISAEYDPEQSESPDITKAHGGFVDKPLYDSPRMVSY